MRPALVPTLSLATFGLILIIIGHLKLTPDFGGYSPRDTDTGLFCLVVGVLLAAHAAFQWFRAAKPAHDHEPAGLSRR